MVLSGALHFYGTCHGKHEDALQDSKKDIAVGLKGLRPWFKPRTSVMPS